ncbi:hypothetical protein DFQ30_008837 [Apophysomyces sp. BC1015]|nr:hypothetical protein DFQ30_008837 [Apophysomyces sp. BC1015]KAG0180266.1 hypothetical protein DFQ29_000963 [Apophysomyces sp. BC1021]
MQDGPCMSNEDLAREFLTCAEHTPLDKLAVEIWRMKRRVRYSAFDFVDRLVASDRAILGPYHQLSIATSSIVSLDTLIARSPHGWLVRQCRMLFGHGDPSPDNRMLKDYLASIIVLSETLENSSERKRIRMVLDDLLDDERQTFGRWNEPTPSKSIHTCYLQALQDSSHLTLFSPSERRRFGMAELSRLSCVTGSPPDLSGWMAAKAMALADENAVLTSRALALVVFARWFREFTDTKEAWPDFLDVTLRKGQEDGFLNPTWVYVFSIGCKGLGQTEQGVVQAVAIMDSLANILTEHLSNNSQNNNDTRQIIMALTFVQIALYYTGDLLGLDYVKWFQSMFVHPETTCLSSETMGRIWIEVLEQLIPYDMPALLQIHSKALTGHPTLSVHAYLGDAKARILELGFDSSARRYPTSMIHPVVSSERTGQREDLQSLIEEFARTKTIPRTLWEDSIFRARWFKMTFLPALFSWTPSTATLLQAKTLLVAELKNKGKIPKNLY